MKYLTLLKASLKRHGGGFFGIFILTLFVSASIENLSEVNGVDIQSLVFSNYTVNGQESDSEGQLITYVPNENRYKFLADDLSGYKNPPDEISRGEVFVSASMVSMFDVKVEDEIIFPVARAGKMPYLR